MVFRTIAAAAVLLVAAGCAQNFEAIEPPPPENAVSAPSVLGLSRREAAAELRRVGLRLGLVREVPILLPERRGERFGDIRHQNPPVGALLAPGSPVDVVVERRQCPSDRRC